MSRARGLPPDATGPARPRKSSVDGGGLKQLGVGPPSEREGGQAGEEGKKVEGKETQSSSEGGGCRVPSLTCNVTIRLRLVTASSMKRHRTRRPRKKM